MSTGSCKAYNELVGVILSGEDCQKFEWMVGAILSDGPPHILVIRGGYATGKTTLMRIARKIIASSENSVPRVYFTHAGSTRGIDINGFAFVERLVYTPLEDEALTILTTGNRLPVHKHYMLMEQIDSELPALAEHCIALYRSLGDDYFDTYQENDR